MPYSSIAASPLKTHKGIKLTLAQINFFFRIYDKSYAAYKKKYKSEKRARKAAGGTAWSVFDSVYMIAGTGAGRHFVRKKKR